MSHSRSHSRSHSPKRSQNHPDHIIDRQYKIIAATSNMSILKSVLKDPQLRDNKDVIKHVYNIARPAVEAAENFLSKEEWNEWSRLKSRAIKFAYLSGGKQRTHKQRK